MKKAEILVLLVAFIIPALLDWIPFTTDTYGSTGLWCWIRSIKENCTINTAGLHQQIALWNVPFGLVALLTLSLVIGNRVCSAMLASSLEFGKVLRIHFPLLLLPLFSCSSHVQCTLLKWQYALTPPSIITTLLPGTLMLHLLH